MLDDVFYELWDEGFIYEEDENGFNMSYGEYAAINKHFEECLLEEFDKHTDLEEALEFLTKTIDDASDDVRLFFVMDEYDNFYYYIDENEDGEKTIELTNIPDVLKGRIETMLENSYLMVA